MSLQEIINWIFKKTTPLEQVYNDNVTTIGNFLGSVEITIAFFVIGFVFVLVSAKSTTEPARKQRIVVSKMIGWALVSCAVARLTEAFAIWYHYPNLGLIIKNITGIIGLIVAAFIPYILRLMKKQATIDEIKNTLEQTHKKVEQLKDLTDKINNA